MARRKTKKKTFISVMYYVFLIKYHLTESIKHFQLGVIRSALFAKKFSSDSSLSELL